MKTLLRVGLLLTPLVLVGLIPISGITAEDSDAKALFDLTEVLVVFGTQVFQGIRHRFHVAFRPGGGKQHPPEVWDRCKNSFSIGVTGFAFGLVERNER